MDKHQAAKKPVTQDWHKADIKAALEKAGWSLRGLSRHYGMTHGSITIALYKKYPTAEKKIALAIGVPPHQIWPSRYEADGRPISKRGNPNWAPGVPRPKKHVTGNGPAQVNRPAAN